MLPAIVVGDGVKWSEGGVLTANKEKPWDGACGLLVWGVLLPWVAMEKDSLGSVEGLWLACSRWWPIARTLVDAWLQGRHVAATDGEGGGRA